MARFPRFYYVIYFRLPASRVLLFRFVVVGLPLTACPNFAPLLYNVSPFLKLSFFRRFHAAEVLRLACGSAHELLKSWWVAAWPGT